MVSYRLWSVLRSDPVRSGQSNRKEIWEMKLENKYENHFNFQPRERLDKLTWMTAFSLSLSRSFFYLINYNITYGNLKKIVVIYVLELKSTFFFICMKKKRNATID